MEGEVIAVKEYLRTRKDDAERFEIFNRYVKKGQVVDWFGVSCQPRATQTEARGEFIEDGGEGVNSEEPRAARLDAREAAGESRCGWDSAG